MNSEQNLPNNSWLRVHIAIPFSRAVAAISAKYDSLLRESSGTDDSHTPACFAAC